MIAMPSANDVRNFVAHALETKQVELTRPWRDALLENIDDAASLTLLGRMADAEGDITGGLAFTGESIRQEPYFIDAYRPRAEMLVRIGSYSEAMRCYEAILLFAPLHEPALLAFCAVAQELRRHQEAYDALQRRFRIGPDTAELQNMLGLVCHALGDLGGALAAYERAIHLNPEFPLYHNNRATILYHYEHYDEALSALHYTLQLDPNYTVAWTNLGNVYKATRRIKLAEEAYRQAIALSPTSPDPHFNLGCMLLHQDKWEEGWAEYEHRWQVPGLVTPIHSDLPRWNGEPIAGKRLMVVAEQGSGDTIQFVRYAEDLTRLGAKVVIWAPVETAALLRRLPYVEAVATNRLELPPAEYHVPMLSLPRLLKARPQNIPLPPYLSANVKRQNEFMRRLGPRRERLRLAIAWAGNPNQVEDCHRSAPLAALAPLFSDESIRWLSVQKGGRAQEISATGFALEDWSPQLESFADTADFLSALDGLVTICSGPVHLAGALGLQTVCMLAWAADWRWRDDPHRTPWYPSVRLMRQSSLNNWREVAARTADFLATWRPKGLTAQQVTC